MGKLDKIKLYSLLEEITKRKDMQDTYIDTEYWAKNAVLAIFEDLSEKDDLWRRIAIATRDGLILSLVVRKDTVFIDITGVINS